MEQKIIPMSLNFNTRNDKNIQTNIISNTNEAFKLNITTDQKISGLNNTISLVIERGKDFQRSILADFAIDNKATFTIPLDAMPFGKSTYRIYLRVMDLTNPDKPIITSTYGQKVYIQQGILPSSLAVGDKANLTMSELIDIIGQYGGTGGSGTGGGLTRETDPLYSSEKSDIIFKTQLDDELLKYQHEKDNKIDWVNNHKVVDGIVANNESIKNLMDVIETTNENIFQGYEDFRALVEDVNNRVLEEVSNRMKEDGIIKNDITIQSNKINDNYDTQDRKNIILEQEIADLQAKISLPVVTPGGSADLSAYSTTAQNDVKYSTKDESAQIIKDAVNWMEPKTFTVSGRINTAFASLPTPGATYENQVVSFEGQDWMCFKFSHKGRDVYYWNEVGKAGSLKPGTVLNRYDMVGVLNSPDFSKHIGLFMGHLKDTNFTSFEGISGIMDVAPNASDFVGGGISLKELQTSINGNLQSINKISTISDKMFTYKDNISPKPTDKGVFNHTTLDYNTTLALDNYELNLVDGLFPKKINLVDSLSLIRLLKDVVAPIENSITSLSTKYRDNLGTFQTLADLKTQHPAGENLDGDFAIVENDPTPTNNGEWVVLHNITNGWEWFQAQSKATSGSSVMFTQSDADNLYVPLGNMLAVKSLPTGDKILEVQGVASDSTRMSIDIKNGKILQNNVETGNTINDLLRVIKYPVLGSGTNTKISFGDGAKATISIGSRATKEILLGDSLQNNWIRIGDGQFGGGITIAYTSGADLSIGQHSLGSQTYGAANWDGLVQHTVEFNFGKQLKTIGTSTNVHFATSTDGTTWTNTTHTADELIKKIDTEYDNIGSSKGFKWFTQNDADDNFHVQVFEIGSSLRGDQYYGQDAEGNQSYGLMALGHLDVATEITGNASFGLLAKADVSVGKNAEVNSYQTYGKDSKGAQSYGDAKWDEMSPTARVEFNLGKDIKTTANGVSNHFAFKTTDTTNPWVNSTHTITEMIKYLDGITGQSSSNSFTSYKEKELDYLITKDDYNTKWYAWEFLPNKIIEHTEEESLKWDSDNNLFTQNGTLTLSDFNDDVIDISTSTKKVPLFNVVKNEGKKDVTVDTTILQKAQNELKTILPNFESLKSTTQEQRLNIALDKLYPFQNLINKSIQTLNDNANLKTLNPDLFNLLNTMNTDNFSGSNDSVFNYINNILNLTDSEIQTSTEGPGFDKAIGLLSMSIPNIVDLPLLPGFTIDVNFTNNLTPINYTNENMNKLTKFFENSKSDDTTPTRAVIIKAECNKPINNHYININYLGDGGEQEYGHEVQLQNKKIFKLEEPKGTNGQFKYIILFAEYKDNSSGNGATLTNIWKTEWVDDYHTLIEQPNPFEDENFYKFKIRTLVKKIDGEPFIVEHEISRIDEKIDNYIESIEGQKYYKTITKEKQNPNLIGKKTLAIDDNNIITIVDTNSSSNTSEWSTILFGSDGNGNPINNDKIQALETFFTTNKNLDGGIVIFLDNCNGKLNIDLNGSNEFEHIVEAPYGDGGEDGDYYTYAITYIDGLLAFNPDVGSEKNTLNTNGLSHLIRYIPNQNETQNTLNQNFLNNVVKTNSNTIEDYIKTLSTPSPTSPIDDENLIMLEEFSKNAIEDGFTSLKEYIKHLSTQGK